ncbi:MAG TPA: flap endonuclease [Gammaproteobacteria bacterium]|nr:flap endonuclease [Gammaproteobacteria bacterium]
MGGGCLPAKQANSDEARHPAWLVDASIYIYRGWHLFPNTLTGRDGHPVNAVIGFLDFVSQLAEHGCPNEVAFAFDAEQSKGFRKEIYPHYKANRKPTPQELKRQFTICREFVRALGMIECAHSRYEGDDIIGTWSKGLQARDQPLVIITADKDLAQLIGAQDLWWDFAGGKKLDARKIKGKYGVRPGQIADQLAIMGDKTDNIPGVQGIGRVMSAKLLHYFNDLENLLSTPDRIGKLKLRGARQLQKLIEENTTQILLSRRLTGLFCDINEPGFPHRLTRRQPDVDELNRLCDFLQLGPGASERWIRLFSFN